MDCGNGDRERQRETRGIEKAEHGTKRNMYDKAGKMKHGFESITLPQP